MRKWPNRWLLSAAILTYAFLTTVMTTSPAAAQGAAVQGDESNLFVIRGLVGGDGSILSGAGFTVSTTVIPTSPTCPAGVGPFFKYTVTFTTSFAAAPAVALGLESSPPPAQVIVIDSSPISGSRPRVPIPTPPGPLRAPPETSSPTSLPKRATRPQRLAALRLGAAAPPLVAPRPTASGPPHAATCPSRSPAFCLDRVFIRAVA